MIDLVPISVDLGHQGGAKFMFSSLVNLYFRLGIPETRDAGDIDNVSFGEVDFDQIVIFKGTFDRSEFYPEIHLWLG